jgi:glycosyltransferase involved in cell wall biosynthesis
MVQVQGTLPRRRRPVSSARGLVSAVLAGRRLRPDALYVYRYWDLPYAVVVGRLTGAPVVLHLCLPPPTVVPGWLRPFLRAVASVLSVSADTVSHWRGTGLPVEHASVVLTGIDLTHYTPAADDARRATRRANGLPEDGFVVLYAGRIGREKGVDVLVRAFTTALADDASAHLVVVGSPSLGADPADSERYQAELRELAGVAPVTWLAARPDVLDLIQCADVAVAPSLWPEPLSRSVMEPLACGVPVVATRVGGNPEILTGWLDEFLVEPHDVEGLGRRVAMLRHWRRDQPDLGARCRREAEARLSLEREVDDVEAAIDRAVRDPQPSRRRSRTSPTDATSCG